MRDIGLVLVQHERSLTHETLISRVQHGLEQTLVESGMRLVTRVVRNLDAELAVYRHWQSTDSVQGVVLVRLTTADPRVAFLEQLSVPFVAITDVRQVGEFSAVTIDSTAMMHTVVDFLTARGRNRIAYVTGPEDIELSEIRVEAFVEASADDRFEASVFRVGHDDQAGAEATREAIAADPAPPTAIIYDDDAAAAAAVESLTAAGLKVPDDIAVIAWSDSVLCQSSVPSITALSEEAHTIGQLAGRAIIETIESGRRVTLAAQPSFIVERESS